MIDVDKYGLIDGYPSTTGVYDAFMAGWRLGKEQTEAKSK